jgi:hypothetical protein
VLSGTASTFPGYGVQLDNTTNDGAFFFEEE